MGKQTIEFLANWRTLTGKTLRAKICAWVLASILAFTEKEKKKSKVM